MVEGVVGMGKGMLEMAQVVQFSVEQHQYLFIPDNGALVEVDEGAAKIVNYLAGRQEIGQEKLLAEVITRGTSLEASLVQESLQELMALGVVRHQPPAKTPCREKTGSAAAHLPHPFPLSTLVLNLAQDCNLACRYCYAQTGSYGQERTLMNLETAKRAVDFLIKESRDLPKVSLTFFGGEPLLNLAVLQDTVTYGRQKAALAAKEIDFNMTTNGTLLNAQVVDYLIEAEIGISVSIDGPPKLHDYWRPLRQGGGSYELINPGLTRLLSKRKGKPVGARVTLAHNFGSLQDIYQHLKELGFWEIGFAPVTSCQKGIALTQAETGALLQQFQQLTEEYVREAISGEYPGFSNLTHVLAELFQGPNRQHPCGAGIGFLAVDTTGELYLCHRFTGQGEAKVGDIWQGIEADKREKVLRQGHIANKPGCAKCQIQSICAGGCYYEAQVQQGSWDRANTHYCTWLKEWIMMTLKAYVQIVRENPQFYNRLFGQAVSC